MKTKSFFQIQQLIFIHFSCEFCIITLHKNHKKIWGLSTNSVKLYQVFYLSFNCGEKFDAFQSKLNPSPILFIIFYGQSLTSTKNAISEKNNHSDYLTYQFFPSTSFQFHFGFYFNFLFAFSFIQYFISFSSHSEVIYLDLFFSHSKIVEQVIM